MLKSINTSDVFALLLLGLSPLVCHATTQTNEMVLGTYATPASGNYNLPLLLTKQSDSNTWSFSPITTNKVLDPDGDITCMDGYCLMVGSYLDSPSSYQHKSLVMKSVDHGASWQFINMPEDANVPELHYGLSNITCVGKTCIAGGSEGTGITGFHPALYVSHNSGNTWKYDTTFKGENALGGYVTDMACNTKNCFVSTAKYSYPHACNTMDILTGDHKGEHWSDSRTINNFPADACGSLEAVHCSKNSCVSVGEWTADLWGPRKPVIVVSVDSGQTWTSITAINQLPGMDYGKLASVTCQNNSCMAAGYYVTGADKDADLYHVLLLLSHDYGLSWNVVQNIRGVHADASRRLNSISCNDAVCVAAGDSVILQSEDQGNTWLDISNTIPTTGYRVKKVKCTHATCMIMGQDADSKPMMLKRQNKTGSWLAMNMTHLPDDLVSGSLSRAAIK